MPRVSRFRLDRWVLLAVVGFAVTVGSSLSHLRLRAQAPAAEGVHADQQIPNDLSGTTPHTRVIPWHNKTAGADEHGILPAGSSPLATWSYNVTSSRDSHAYSGVMVGTSPFTSPNTSTTVTMPVIPLIIKLSDGTTFDPTHGDPCASAPLTNTSPLALFQQSPILQNHAYTMNGVDVGTTQYVDAFQRANFWTVAGASYHAQLSPTTLSAVTVNVPAANGRAVNGGCGKLGEVEINWIGTYVENTLIPSLAAQGVTPSTFPLFLLSNVVMYDTVTANCCILGYHSAFGANPQTYSISDFDTSRSFTGVADTSVISHEIAEWLDDPLGNNLTPPWGGIGQQSGCQNNLEVGDPLTGTNVPNVTMPNGYTYHLQEQAFYSWFLGGPSTGAGGKYSNNGTFVGAAKPCPPGGTGDPATCTSVRTSSSAHVDDGSTAGSPSAPAAPCTPAVSGQDVASVGSVVRQPSSVFVIGDTEQVPRADQADGATAAVSTAGGLTVTEAATVTVGERLIQPRFIVGSDSYYPNAFNPAGESLATSVARKGSGWAAFSSELAAATPLALAADGKPGLSAFDVSFDDVADTLDTDSVSVSLSIRDARAGDLTLWLSAGGRDVLLWDGSASGESNAGIVQTSGSTLHIDRLLATELAGEPLTGHWTLHIANRAEARSGVLEAASILVQSRPVGAPAASAVNPAAAVDIVALNSYMRTAAAGGGSVVGTPSVGQTVFFHADFQVTGSSTVTYSVRAVLDGTTICAGPLTSGAGNWTTWCNAGWATTSGAHTLRWDIDYTNTVAETDETNNSASKTFTSLTGVDLAALSSYLTTAASGGTIVATPGVGQTVFLHTDYQVLGSGNVTYTARAVRDGATVCSGTFTNSPGTYGLACSAGWAATAGAHTITWDLDYTSSVAETNESNNSVLKTFTTASVDLAPSIAYLRTAASGGGTVVATPTVGQTVYFHADYQVTGSGSPVSYAVRAVLDGTVFCAGTPSAAPGTSWSISCVTGWVATSGAHTLTWDFDYLNALTETNESNNSVAKTFTPTAGGGIDLAAQSAYLRTAANGGSTVATPATGQTVFFHLDFQTTGTGSASNYGLRAVLDGSTFCSGTFTTSAGSTSTVWCTTGWTATAGAHTLTWELDYGHVVTETNESNNSATKTFTPTAPTLDIEAQRAYLRTAVDGGGAEVAAPSVGQTVFPHVDWRVTGSGSAVTVTERLLIDGQVFCSCSSTATPGETYRSSCSQGWVATSGSHTIRWDLDYGNTVAESNESNNSASMTFTSASGPAATTGSATSIGTTSATLNGTINPHGTATTASFQYGLTGSYGSSTSAVSIGSATSASSLSTLVTGLTCGTTYHFRVTATSSAGTTNGADATFATATCQAIPATGAASGVTDSTATLNASVNPHGLATTARFQYGVTASYGTNTVDTSLGAGASAIAISRGVSSLTCATTYHFRVTATNAGGTVNGADASFTTAACPPTAVTNATTSITGTSATVNASVGPRGLATDALFQYGPTVSYGATTSTVSLGSGTSTVAVSKGLTGLTCGTAYHVRVSATSSAGTTNGNDATFTTSPCPTAVTGTASGIHDVFVTLNGTINPRGTATTAMFQYGPTTSYGSSTSAVSVGAGTSASPLSTVVSGLACATAYHFRVTATSSAGTTDGNDATFTTALCLPTAATGSASSITASTATLGATINPRGTATTAVFQYGLTTSYGISTTASSLGAGSSDVALPRGVTGLTCSATYHFRVSATSAAGTTNGADATFTTAPCPPTAVTNAATNITGTSATVNASVGPRGLATDAIFEYGPTASYGVTTSAVSLGSGTSTVAVSRGLTGLTCGITYHFRVSATSSAGTTNGNDATFTASSCPAVVTGAATTIHDTFAALTGTVNPRGLVTTASFQYGPTASYGSSTTAVNVGAGTSASPVATMVTGFTCATAYHFRLNATSSAGTTNGSDATFTTAACPPTATTGAASSISATLATLNGTVNPHGTATFISFQYGRTTSYGSATPMSAAGAGTSDSAIGSTVAGLACATTYHFRITATSSAGAANGADATFTTAACPPIAFTTAAGSITATSAILNGTVNPNGVATSAVFQYGLTTGYGATGTTVNVGSGTAVVAQSFTASSLTCGTTYHYRMTAASSAGNASGADLTFVTSACPTAVTSAASAITGASATLNGIVNPRGTATSAFFQYGLTTSYGSTSTTVNVGAGTANVARSFVASSLSCGTQYHFRMVAQSVAGTANGADLTFTTAGCPTAVTSPASNITLTSVRLNGIVNPHGLATTAVFQYGLTTAYGTATTGVNVGAGSANVSQSVVVSSLTCGTTYHFRMVAQASAGTGNGSDATFTTSACV